MNQDIEVPSSIYFCIGRMLTIAPLQENELHHHGAIQITLAMEQPFSIRIEDGDWRETYAVIIDSNVPHQLKDLHGLQISLSIGDQVLNNHIGLNADAAIIKGNVVSSGFPVVEATVYAVKNSDTLSTVTNSEGEFIFSLVPGIWNFIAVKESFQSNFFNGVAVQPGQLIHGIEIDLIRYSGLIKGD